MNNQDCTYLFSLFDTIGLNDFSRKTIIVFVYSIYDNNRKDEIKREEFNKVINIINLYDGERNMNGMLLETLSANGRIKLIEHK